MPIVVALVALIVAALGYFVFRLIYMAVGSYWATRGATQQAQLTLAVDLGNLSTDALRSRLLEDPYLAVDLRSDAGVQAFLSRIADGDEIALAQEYPRDRLLKLLGEAELKAGSANRESVVDTISEISSMLQALAARTREGGASGPTKDWS